MTNAIGAINGNTTTQIQSVSAVSSGSLSEETKRKLEALGINTTNIKSETEGLARLEEAQAVQAVAQVQNKPQQSASSMETIEDEANALASTMGISIGSDEEISNIFANISAKIVELQSTAGNDATKQNQIFNYQNQYTALYGEYSQMQASQNMTGATALGNYNKVALGLAA